MMVPWRLQKRFFQAGHSVSTPVHDPQEINREKLEKKINKRKLPKKGKINNPPESAWRDVGDDTEVEKKGSENLLENRNCDGEKLKIEINENQNLRNSSEVRKDVEKEVEEEVEKSNQIEKEVEREVEDISPEGRCEHMREEGDQLLFQRYCHVYQAGELEDLCSW